MHTWGVGIAGVIAWDRVVHIWAVNVWAGVVVLGSGHGEDGEKDEHLDKKR